MKKKTSPLTEFKAWYLHDEHTVRSAAKKIGVSRFAIQGWMNRTFKPAFENAKKIEKATGIKAERWFE